MAKKYHCPQCKQNKTHFQLIKKLAQEVRKDPDSGRITWASDEWEEVLEGDAVLPDVKCLVCGYAGQESQFLISFKKR